MPLIHKARLIVTGEPSVLWSIVNFYFCMDGDLPRVSPHQCRRFFIWVFSFTLKVECLGGFEGLWVAASIEFHCLMACHFNSSGTCLATLHTYFLLSSRHADVFSDQLQVGKINSPKHHFLQLIYHVSFRTTDDQPECMLRIQFSNHFHCKKKLLLAFAIFSNDFKIA